MNPRALTHVSSRSAPGADNLLHDLDRALTALAGRPPSRLSLHAARCCRDARGWFEAMARSHASRGANEPVWITARWSWGPNPWPLCWCEALEATELDCGALAELAEAALKATGAEVCRVQLVESSHAEQVAHWQARWEEVRGAEPWIWGSLVYHEAVGVLDGATLRVWDPTEGAWRTLTRGAATGRTVAIRLVSDSAAEVQTPHLLGWDGVELPIGRWTALPQG